MEEIRNFVIIAHIDHGKSTLADRFLEITGTIPKNKMRPQYLDQLTLERERGITIKLAPVRMSYHLPPTTYILNLIDTPGHVDFSYEVSRSLAAVEGAILLVDATTGVQAQTLANLELAQKQGLKIIPVINKIDLPNADIYKVVEELKSILPPTTSVLPPLLCSAKTGEGVEKVLETVIKYVPSPKGLPAEASAKAGDKPLRALIFDSFYDPFRGVVLEVRVFEGEIKKGDKIRLMQSKAEDKALEVGYFSPALSPTSKLSAGEIGYIVTGLKDTSRARVGDTVTSPLPITSQLKPLAGYQEPKPMVFASIFSQSGEDFNKLKDGLAKLKLNDASLVYNPETSIALGVGFRVGFLGMLHAEIVKERLEREYGLSLVITRPAVDYQKTDSSYREPWIRLEIITPYQYQGAIFEELHRRRAKLLETRSLGERLLLICEAPLSEIIVDFYDRLKTISSGYASMNYELIGYRKADLVPMDILVAGEVVEPLFMLVPRSSVQQIAKATVVRLKELIPRQSFEVKIQAVAGEKILASESIPPLRKDVTAKLYGGDVTRKKKLLEKQKAGKRRMKMFGKVEIPAEVFMEVLKK